MAYYIFLKSLRSPEEFRKNPHVRIPPKSPSTNFPSLGKFKIQFLFEKNSSYEFSPLGPADLPTHESSTLVLRLNQETRLSGFEAKALTNHQPWF
jgi:hypothetical protein